MWLLCVELCQWTDFDSSSFWLSSDVTTVIFLSHLFRSVYPDWIKARGVPTDRVNLRIDWFYQAVSGSFFVTESALQCWVSLLLRRVSLSLSLSLSPLSLSLSLSQSESCMFRDLPGCGGRERHLFTRALSLSLPSLALYLCRGATSRCFSLSSSLCLHGFRVLWFIFGPRAAAAAAARRRIFLTVACLPFFEPSRTLSRLQHAKEVDSQLGVGCVRSRVGWHTEGNASPC